MAAEFQNLSGNSQQAKVVIVQQNINGDTSSSSSPSSSSSSSAQSVTSKTQTGGSYIENKQNKRNQVFEQFIREVKRLDIFKQNQMREFQVHYGEQPQLQLATEVSSLMKLWYQTISVEPMGDGKRSHR